MQLLENYAMEYIVNENKTAESYSIKLDSE